MIEFQGHAQLRSKFEVSLRYVIASLEAPRREEEQGEEEEEAFLEMQGRDFGVGRIDEDTVVSPQNRIFHNPFMRDASRPPQLLSFLGDSWGIFLSHPRDFAPVFTTEVGRTINPALEFVERNRHVGHLFNRQC